MFTNAPLSRLTFFITLFFVWYPASEVAEQLPVDYIQKYAIEISTDPSNEDYSDLSGLKKYIGQARIVMLGEQWHGDGTTFSTKVRLIKYLHDKLGFEVLLFENPMFESGVAWREIRNGRPAVAAVKSAIYPLWSHTHEFAPLIPYVEKLAQTSSPLIIDGFDPQWSRVGTTGRSSLNREV